MVSRRVEKVEEIRKRRSREKRVDLLNFSDEHVPSWNCKKCLLAGISKTLSVCPACGQGKK